MQLVTPEYLASTKAGKGFPGSMGPKIEAAINFVEKSKNPRGAWAVIGDLNDADKLFSNEEGTMIKLDVPGNVVWRERAEEEGAPYKPQKLTKDPPKYG
jgi:carbamate kinase